MWPHLNHCECFGAHTLRVDYRLFVRFSLFSQVHVLLFLRVHFFLSSDRRVGIFPRTLATGR